MASDSVLFAGLKDIDNDEVFASLLVISASFFPLLYLVLCVLICMDKCQLVGFTVGVVGVWKQPLCRSISCLSFKRRKSCDVFMFVKQFSLRSLDVRNYGYEID